MAAFKKYFRLTISLSKVNIFRIYPYLRFTNLLTLTNPSLLIEASFLALWKLSLILRHNKKDTQESIEKSLVCLQSRLFVFNLISIDTSSFEL